MLAASLKSPQCGDFLQTLVKRWQRSFACYETKKVKNTLEKSNFLADAGTSSLERWNERSIL